MNEFVSIKEKSGHLMVEASILLPLFLFLLAAFLWFLQLLQMEESLIYVASIQMRKASVIATVKEEREGVEKTAFLLGMKLQMEEGNLQDNNNQLSINFLKKSENKSNKKLIEIEVNSTYLLPDHTPWDIYKGKLYFTGRKFIGSREEINNVWVFPVAGEKYHDGNCVIVSSYAKSYILSKNLKKNYRSCSLCHSEQLEEGSHVYCYSRSGEAYHRKNCSVIDKYKVRMNLTRAVKAGYTPCILCGEE